MTGELETESDDVRAKSVTYPRGTRLRRISRTSPSHLAKTPGSLMLGVKNRWLTLLTSTVVLSGPTKPSAVPNPVMLFIMPGELNYAVSMTCQFQNSHRTP